MQKCSELTIRNKMSRFAYTILNFDSSGMGSNDREMENDK